MITILAVGTGETLAPFGVKHPSIEVVTAHGAEEALERLARNRRIDAVLILAGTEAVETARLIREEDPGAPPLFAPVDAGRIPGARSLDASAPAELLEALAAELGPP